MNIKIVDNLVRALDLKQWFIVMLWLWCATKNAKSRDDKLGWFQC
jgi:hypothetical protein